MKQSTNVKVGGTYKVIGRLKHLLTKRAVTDLQDFKNGMIFQYSEHRHSYKSFATQVEEISFQQIGADLLLVALILIRALHFEHDFIRFQSLGVTKQNRLDKSGYSAKEHTRFKWISGDSRKNRGISE